MSTTAHEFKSDVIGQWSEPASFEVTRERIQAYAAATNDPIAPHRDGEFASPVFAIVPAFATAGQAALNVIPGELLMMVAAWRAGLPLPRPDPARDHRDHPRRGDRDAPAVIRGDRDRQGARRETSVRTSSSSST